MTNVAETADSTVARLEAAADSGTGVRFVGASVMTDGEPVHVSWRQIHDEARAVASGHRSPVTRRSNRCDR